MPEVKNVHAVYHRNGIGGRGFVIVSFAFKDEDTFDWEPFFAIVFENERAELADERHDLVAVLQAREFTEAYPDNLDRMRAWRGDVVWPYVAPHLQEALDTYFRRKVVSV